MSAYSTLTDTLGQQIVSPGITTNPEISLRVMKIHVSICFRERKKSGCNISLSIIYNRDLEPQDYCKEQTWFFEASVEKKNLSRPHIKTKKKSYVVAVYLYYLLLM